MHAIQTKTFENFLPATCDNQVKLQAISAIVLLILGTALIIYSAVNQSALYGHETSPLTTTRIIVPLMGGLSCFLGLARVGGILFAHVNQAPEPAPVEIQQHPHEIGVENVFFQKSFTPGKCIHIAVKEGDIVRENQVLYTIECMKMEMQVCASRSGTIKKIHLPINSIVGTDQILFTIEP